MAVCQSYSLEIADFYAILLSTTNIFANNICHCGKEPVEGFVDSFNKSLGQSGECSSVLPKQE